MSKWCRHRLCPEWLNKINNVILFLHYPLLLKHKIPNVILNNLLQLFSARTSYRILRMAIVLNVCLMVLCVRNLE